MLCDGCCFLVLSGVLSPRLHLGYILFWIGMQANVTASWSKGLWLSLWSWTPCCCLLLCLCICFFGDKVLNLRMDWLYSFCNLLFRALVVVLCTSWCWWFRGIVCFFARCVCLFYGGFIQNACGMMSWRWRRFDTVCLVCGDSIVDCVYALCVVLFLLSSIVS